MTERRDYLAANHGRRMAAPGFVLLARPRGDGQPAIRVGITATKKIGNAVARNRAKRRLRALARELLGTAGLSGTDYVLIARHDTAARGYAAMRSDLARAIAKLSP